MAGLSFLIVSTGFSKEKESEILASFPGLSSLGIGGEAAQKISYDSALSKVIDQPLPKTEGAEEVRRLLSTRLNREGGAQVFVDFDPGPSADPMFVITDAKTQQRVGAIGADVLVLPGNGFVYAIGRSNNMHLERQKFVIREGKLEEIKQPFSYVGLESKANVPLTLTSEKGGGEMIANIPKGDALQVVIRDGDFLLIKTQFGLVGWWKMKADVMADNAEIEGIYYAGD